MNFKCPKCNFVFSDRYKYCPNCGYYMKYPDHRGWDIDNWQASGWERFSHGLNDANQKMNGNKSGCGCFSIIGIIILIILLFAIF